MSEDPCTSPLLPLLALLCFALTTVSVVRPQWLRLLQNASRAPAAVATSFPTNETVVPGSY